MNIDLVGSNGFIGKTLQKVNAGINLRSWSHSAPNQARKFDLYDQNSWKNLLEIKPENVILLSWPGLPNYDETFHFKKNLPACFQLVEKLSKVGLRSLVVAGTCYEYGMHNGSLKENLNVEPINNYAISKDTLRKLLNIYCQQNKIRFCWARIFYPYGIGQNQNSLLPSLEKAVSENREYFKMSSGNQIRDFIKCSDLARMIMKLAISQSASGVYNCGSGIPISIKEFVKQKVDEMESNIKLEFGAFKDRENEPSAFWANMEKYKKLLEE